MIGFILKFRYLPATIFAAALMLTVKVGDIMEGFDGIANGTISVATAGAQAPAPAPPAVKPAVPVEGKGERKAEGMEQPAAAAKPEAEPESETRPRMTDDPTLLTLTEIDLLQQLAERRELLDKQAREMEVQASLLTAAEARINKKVEQLKVLQTTIEKLLKQHEDQQDAKMTSLVKIYENMKPKNAARIFEEMDMETLLLVAEGMKERKLAPVMAQMDPQKAKEMTVQLTRQGQIPRAGSRVGG